MKKLGKLETKLVAGSIEGHPDIPSDQNERLFLMSRNKLIKDRDVWDRIEWLRTEVLELVGIEKVGGWEKLYRDPEDGRYWFLTYPFSELQGGGPPSLINQQLNQSEIKARFVTPAEWDAHMEKYIRDNNIRVITPDDKA
jgi:hypothetical protein